MMNDLARWNPILAESLHALCPDVETIQAGRWRIPPPCEGFGPTVVGLEEESLRFFAALEKPRKSPKHTPWEVLLGNSGLEGNARFALAPEQNVLCVLADFPLFEGMDLERKIEEAFRNLCSAGAKLQEKSAAEETPSTPTLSPGSPEMNREDLSRRLASSMEECGFDFTEREPGERTPVRFAVNLEQARAYDPAMVELERDGGVRLSMELCSLRELSPSCRNAVGLLLLGACWHLRHIRAGIREGESRSAACLEARFPVLPEAGELSSALSACAVGHTLYCEEVKALHDAPVASRYLSMYRWSWGSCLF